MEQFWEILFGLSRTLLAGGVFAVALHYMEGRRILRGICQATGCAAMGLCMNLLSDWLLYRVVGFLRHPLLALLAGFALAALAAAAVSAAGCLAAVIRKQRLARRKVRRERRSLPLPEVRRRRLTRAA